MIAHRNSTNDAICVLAKGSQPFDETLLIRNGWTPTHARQDMLVLRVWGIISNCGTGYNFTPKGKVAAKAIAKAIAA